MEMAKIERRFEVCPISEFYIYYAEFMVISGLLGILRRTLSSHWKGFHGSSAPKTFDHTQQARFSSLEVHVFNRERCLQEFLIKAVERPPEQNQVFGNQQLDWCKNEQRELLWELPVSFRNTTGWWVADEDVAGISLNARWGVLWFANVRLVAFLLTHYKFGSEAFDLLF